IERILQRLGILRI
ncbi:putative S-adenosyl-L-methionine-dependent methyltransferase TehB, partial [Haemophilus influenzae]